MVGFFVLRIFCSISPAEFGLTCAMWFDYIAILSCYLKYCYICAVVLGSEFGKNYKTIMIKMVLFHFYNHINPLAHSQAI